MTEEYKKENTKILRQIKEDSRLSKFSSEDYKYVTENILNEYYKEHNKNYSYNSNIWFLIYDYYKLKYYDQLNKNLDLNFKKEYISLRNDSKTKIN